jgi:hypothetical protein
VRLSCLGSFPHSVAEDLLVLAHRSDSDMIAGLVHTGLARARREIVEAGGPPIEVLRKMVTNAGCAGPETRQCSSLGSSVGLPMCVFRASSEGKISGLPGLGLRPHCCPAAEMGKSQPEGSVLAGRDERGQVGPVPHAA